MRTKLTLIALTLAVLVVGCHRKGGGYLSPAPANTSAAR
jgi:predicted small lipoprotein YifL